MTKTTNHTFDLFKDLAMNQKAVIHTTGESMIPTIKPGDSITFRRCPAAEILLGDIIVFFDKHLDQIIAHRVTDIRHGTLFVTKGDNCDYIDVTLLKEEDILGVVELPTQTSFQKVLRNARLFLKNTPKINIELNLGIKRYFRKLTALAYKSTYHLLYLISEKSTQIVNRKRIHHYGGDYRVKIEKSQNIEIQPGFLGYGDLISTLIKNQKPKRVLFIGSMFGFMPYIAAKACQENGFGHVDFVDAGYNIADSTKKKQHFFGQGFWNEVDFYDHFSWFLPNPEQWISLHIQTSDQFFKQTKHTYDFIYLDGDHSYEGAKKDVRNSWEVLNKEGMICLHDIHVTEKIHGMDLEFWKIWKSLSKMKHSFEISNHVSGLGFIQKLEGSKLPIKL